MLSRPGSAVVMSGDAEGPRKHGTHTLELQTSPWTRTKRSGVLSIIIPSHNPPDLLGPCLDSVTRHAPAGAEIVVVDDASPAGCASGVAASFPHVRCLGLPRRRGFCAAVNAGIAAVTHVVVELLNDDTEVAAG